MYKFEPGLPGCPPRPPGGEWFFVSQHAVGSDFQIAVDNCISWFRIYAVDPYTQDIGRVTITGGGSPSTVIVSITPTISGPSVPGAENFRGIHVSDANVRPKVEVDGWIAGNITDGIDAGRFAFRVDGSAQAPLRSRKAGSNSWLEAANTTAAGTLYADQGNISSVSVTGTIAGDITAATGRINTIACGSLQANVTAHTVSNVGVDTINVTNNIGSPSNPVTITAVGDVRFVTAGNAWANIAVTGTQRTIHRIATTGDFTGSISAFAVDYANTTFQSGVQVGGNLDADVTFSGYCAARLNQVGGSFPAGRTLWIGQAWNAPSGQTREMEFGSLGGQIIINGIGGASEWNSPITVNGHRLANNEAQPNQAPYYERSSSSLGGGAIGRAPFQLHGTDCDPPNGAFVGSGTPESVMLRHYGPVPWYSGTMPVTVEYQLPGFGIWIDITDDFAAMAGPTPRDIVIKPLTLADFDHVTYRIRPIRSMDSEPSEGRSVLRCFNVTGAPPVGDYEYILNP